MSPVRQPRAVKPNALLLILCAATFMSSLDLFIVNVGLRSIGHDVGQSSLAHLSWILNAYAIVFAALLVPAGRLADRYGNKQAFLVGLGLFTVGSIGCASSGELWLIVGLRCLQAVGAAALVPSSLGLILTAIPAERRKQSIQIWAVSGSLGAAAGPTLGGLLVQVSWRWVFLVNVPIGVSALLAAALLAPNLKHSVETRMPDLLGGLLLILAVGSLALALEQGSTWGWGSPSTIVCFALSAGSLILFVVRSARHEAPVMPLGLFRHREFTWANVAVVLISIAFAMQLLGLVLWLQEGWGWSALRTGLGIAPGPAVVSVTAIGLRRFTAPLPAGIVAAAGALVISAGGALIAATLGVTPNYAGEVLPGWLLIGAGVGLALPTIIAAGSAGLAPHQASTGSAVVQMNRQIGSVLGVALLVVLLGTPAASSRNLHSVTEAWWWATCFAVVAATTALGITTRRKETMSPLDRPLSRPTSRLTRPAFPADDRRTTARQRKLSGSSADPMERIETMIKHSIEINRPAEEVFAYLDQVDRHSEWQGALVSATVETDGPVRVGTRVVERRNVPGGPRDIPYEITEHDPPRKASFRGTAGLIRPLGTYTVDPIDQSSSRMNSELDLKGHGIGKLFAILARRQVAKQMPLDHKKFKELLESGAAASS